MMDNMRELQERMLSMANVLSNAADISGARAFLTDFARDVGRMQRRFARVTVPTTEDTPVAPVVAPAGIASTVVAPVAIRAAVTVLVSMDVDAKLFLMLRRIHHI
jgi:uncharacterized heparinase superfamily protein